MKSFIIFVSFSFYFLIARASSENAFYIGNPLDLKDEASNAVLARFPHAELWLIQNYSRKHWDEGCSQFGWAYLFVGYENGLEKDVQIKFDHAKQLDGTCKYIVRKDLEVEPNQVVGIQRLSLDKVQIGFEEAQEIAKKAANLPFKVWWAKLVTPLHPAAVGRVFWNFKGPVECNKGAELTIDATTGKLETLFSTIPTCP